LKIIIGKKMFDCSRCSGSPQSEELQDLAIFWPVRLLVKAHWYSLKDVMVPMGPFGRFIGSALLI
jgi:hypothetical protein